MTLPTSLGAYGDVRQAFDQTLSRGDIYADFQSRAHMHRWRARAYYYRQLLTEREGGAANPFHGITIKAAPTPEFPFRLHLTTTPFPVQFSTVTGTPLPRTSGPIEAAAHKPDATLSSEEDDFINELTRGAGLSLREDND